MSNSTTVFSSALVALVLGAATLAPSAQAQSCDSSVPVHSSYPADGATGVPTNAPVYIYGPGLEMGSADITLEDDSGEAVSIDVQSVEGGLLVDAFLGFAPSTTYELTLTPGAGQEEWSATFTTGTGPAPIVQLRAPDVTVSVLDQERGTCGVVSAICVFGTAAANRTLEVLVGDEVLSIGSSPAAPVLPASGGTVAANECIEIRVREPGGAVSESTRLCGDDLQRFELGASAAVPTSCAAYAVAPATSNGGGDSESSSESGGCALSPRRAASSSGAGWIALGALLGMCWRGSRRLRRKG